MPKYDARAELAPRDIVARAIYQEMREHQLEHVLLDIRHRGRDFIEQHFPTVVALCRKVGIDP
ncbi:L-aspartate oxidase [Oligella ureolytica]